MIIVMRHTVLNGKMVPSERAEGFEKKLDGMEASGYVVSLREYTVRPAKKEEVTF